MGLDLARDLCREAINIAPRLPQHHVLDSTKSSEVVIKLDGSIYPLDRPAWQLYSFRRKLAGPQELLLTPLLRSSSDTLIH